MKWYERFSSAEQPSEKQISEFVANPLWDGFNSAMQAVYGVTPCVQYSTCSGAPGWNVKYRKGGRALCTLYPDEGFFTCLVTVGSREEPQAGLLLPLLTPQVRELYMSAKPFNGARWLMIPVTGSETSEDAKRLVALRVHKA